MLTSHTLDSTYLNETTREIINYESLLMRVGSHVPSLVKTQLAQIGERVEPRKRQRTADRTQRHQVKTAEVWQVPERNINFRQTQSLNKKESANIEGSWSADTHGPHALKHMHSLYSKIDSVEVANRSMRTRIRHTCVRLAHSLYSKC